MADDDSPAVSYQALPLSVEAVTVRFAGVTALAGVSFGVAPGSIHAVIGPNGAGKSTLFNVLSGVYRATEGRVTYGPHVLSSLPPDRIARLGVARTFQNLALFRGMSVEQNLLLGRHHLTRSGFLAGGLRLPSARREESRHRARAAEIAEFLGIGDKLALSVGDLSYGDQKRVELGRALNVEPSLLLLDEPVAGMNSGEKRAMARTIAEIRSALGLSIVLVEHDMGTVMSIADRVTVLDFGARIADGPPGEVKVDPRVIEAYLGTGDDQGDHSVESILQAAGPTTQATTQVTTSKRPSPAFPAAREPGGAR